MSSMNWLGFSLSSQELASQPANQDHSRLGFSSDEISGTGVSGECCYLTSDDSAAHSLSLPPPFGMLEAFNRNNNNNNITQQEIEWAEIKGMGSNTEKYKMSMVIGSSSSSSSREQEPKLENLLGRHSLQSYGEEAASSASGDYIIPNSGLQVGGSTSSSIGLSMIKTWLRNQPTHKNESGSGSRNNNANAHTQTQTLSLSMSTGSSSPVLPLLTPNVGAAGVAASSSHNTNTQTKTSNLTQTPPPTDSALPRKSIDTFGQRTSIYRGVTRHRWTGRYEAHLWDNSCRREGQTRKGRQVYLGGYDKEEKAARAYDLAALKYWGTTTTTNFPISNYEKELEEMKHMTRQEYVASLRRKSSGFSRGASIYRGVTRHHQHGRWQARIGRVAGNKDLYLGTFSTQEEAAEAYDIAAIKFRGLNAVTNFDMSRYDVKSILESSTLPIGGAAKRLKDVEHAQVTTPTLGDICQTQQDHNSNSFSNININSNSIISTDSATWPPTLSFHPPCTLHYPYGQLQRLWCKQEQDSGSHHHHDAAFTFHQDLIHHHDFLQSNNSSSAAFLTMDSSHSADAYADADVNASYGFGGGGYLTPQPTDANHNQTSIANGFGDSASAYQTVFPPTDPHHHASRNLYYISPVDGAVKASAFDQASAWVPTAIPTLAHRSTNMPLCPQPPPSSLLHDQ